MNFWNDEGFLTHSFHTIVIDRKGGWPRISKEINLLQNNWAIWWKRSCVAQT